MTAFQSPSAKAASICSAVLRLVMVALLAAGSVASSPAIAQSHCETYGRLALEQQRANEQRKCGFKGDAWSSDLRAHIAWCMSVGPDQSKAALQQRNQQLETACKR